VRCRFDRLGVAPRFLGNLDERVSEVVKKLKDKGFVSPYLRSFVVARINPLRWIQGEPPPLEEVLKTMRDRAARLRGHRQIRNG